VWEIGVNRLLLGLAIATALAVDGSAGGRQAERLHLEGAWRLVSYVKADTQVRYKTDGYMMFSKTHWTHVAFFNRDPRERDFSEAHHGTYRVTGPDTLVLEVDMELHMDPKTEFQKTPVWYGPPATVNSKYRRDGNTIVMDFASGAQTVIERIE
jgi:hypothetical protein